MAKYLISFPSAAMIVPDGEWEAVGRDAHAVIDEAKAAGVYVFGGGIEVGVLLLDGLAAATFADGPGAQQARPGLVLRRDPVHVLGPVGRELGVLGLASLAVIFFGLLWRGVRGVAKSTGLYRALIWGSIAALVLYLVHGLFDSPYWKNDLSVEFWIVAALQVIAVRGARIDARLMTGPPTAP